MDCSTPGSPVLHYLLEFTQTHFHRVGDAIQPSHPLSSPSSLPQSFAESGSFPMSLLFTSGGQSLVASALASVLPINIQGWFPLGLTGLISLLSRGLSRVFQHHSSKASILWCSVFFMVQLSHLYLTTGKIIALTTQACVGIMGLDAGISNAILLLKKMSRQRRNIVFSIHQTHDSTFKLFDSLTLLALGRWGFMVMHRKLWHHLRPLVMTESCNSPADFFPYVVNDTPLLWPPRNQGDGNQRVLKSLP